MRNFPDSIVLSVLFMSVILLISILFHLIIESLCTSFSKNIKYNILVKLSNRYLKFKYSVIDLF